MKKTLGIIILLSATNSYAGNKANEPFGKSFNWATVDKYTLQETIYERLKRETPYPTEINIDSYKLDEITREIQTNISKYNSEEKEKCNKKSLPKNVTPPQEPTNGRVITDSESYKYYAAINSSEIEECHSMISNMSEYKALELKQREISNIGQKRRDFDQSLRKKSETILDVLINEYSLSNNIQLIIDNRSSVIVYNRDLIVLEVTPKIKAIITSKKTINE